MTTLRIADLFCGAGGNAVPCGFSRALIAAHLTQRADVAHVMREAA